jgi:hypothetical protein
MVAVLVVMCALASTGRVEAVGNSPMAVIYTGPASSGGTVTLGVRPDQSAVLWISLQDVVFPAQGKLPCSATISSMYYASPPAAIGGSGFDVSLWEVHAATAVDGQVDSSTVLSGTAQRNITYPIPCSSQSITWTATAGPSTPPAKFDKHFTGSLGTGTMDVWTRYGTRISAVQFDGITDPCDVGWGYQSVSAAFDPPAIINEDDSSLVLIFAPSWGGAFVTMSRPSQGLMDGSVRFLFAYGDECTYPWTGTLVTPDTDSDGCLDIAEEQTAVGSQTSGGLRVADDPHDYMNPTHDGQNRVDDMMMVLGQYFIDSGHPNYNPDTDRTLTGPNLWNTGPPNGLQRVDDIVNQLNQYFHDCS